jgi:hypothetical protein
MPFQIAELYGYPYAVPSANGLALIVGAGQQSTCGAINEIKKNGKGWRGCNAGSLVAFLSRRNDSGSTR